MKNMNTVGKRLARLDVYSEFSDYMRTITPRKVNDVLVTVGPSPRYEFELVREKIVNAKIIAVDMDETLCQKARHAGADRVLNLNLGDSISARQLPYLTFANLDLYGLVTSEDVPDIVMNVASRCGGGGMAVWLPYGRETEIDQVNSIAESMLSDEVVYYHQGRQRTGVRAVDYHAEVPHTIRNRILFLIHLVRGLDAHMALRLGAPSVVWQYRSNEMPMFVVMWLFTSHARRCVFRTLMDHDRTARRLRVRTKLKDWEKGESEDADQNL